MVLVLLTTASKQYQIDFLKNSYQKKSIKKETASVVAMILSCC
jgi:hypothetical protein